VQQVGLHCKSAYSFSIYVHGSNTRGEYSLYPKIQVRDENGTFGTNLYAFPVSVTRQKRLSERAALDLEGYGNLFGCGIDAAVATGSHKAVFFRCRGFKTQMKWLTPNEVQNAVCGGQFYLMEA